MIEYYHRNDNKKSYSLKDKNMQRSCARIVKKVQIVHMCILLLNGLSHSLWIIALLWREILSVCAHRSLLFYACTDPPRFFFLRSFLRQKNLKECKPSQISACKHFNFSNKVRFFFFLSIFQLGKIVIFNDCFICKLRWKISNFLNQIIKSGFLLMQFFFKVWNKNL